MAKQLEAVFEHGVLRPLEPLTLPEHQHVWLTVDEKPGQTPRQPVNPRTAELEWLAKESAPYAGQWVVLDGRRLIAHGPKLAPVREAALAPGIGEPFFASIPDQDLPFGGW